MRRKVMFIILAMLSLTVVMASSALSDSTDYADEVIINYINRIYSCNDQNLGNLQTPGIPQKPTRTSDYDACPHRPYFTRINSKDYYVYRKRMHNRRVTVAFQKTYPITLQGRVDFSNFVFDTWAIFWREFNGFPYDSYSVAIGKNFETCNAFGSGHDAATTRKALAAHEIYHAWNGDAFDQKAGKMWFMEGLTTYMGDIRQSKEGTPFTEEMVGRYNH